MERIVKRLIAYIIGKGIVAEPEEKIYFYCHKNGYASAGSFFLLFIFLIALFLSGCAGNTSDKNEGLSHEVNEENENHK